MTEMDCRPIRLTIAYDGSRWHGWQVQDNAPTVQQAVSDAIFRTTGERVLPHGAGRTDAGVHARGQVALFRTSSRIPAERFRDALNSLLPDSISVLESEEAAADFHPQRSAVAKHYRYQILNRRSRDPFLAGRAWHVPGPIRLDLLQAAANAFLGHHDFHAFCASGHATKTYDRTIHRSEWREEGGLLVFDTVGSGFLYNMVRIMVGTMVDSALCGAKREEGRPAPRSGRWILPEDIPDVIASGDRAKAGRTAPPDGLYMMRVHYRQEPDWLIGGTE